MSRRLTAILLVLPVALSACGSSKHVDTASYTCGQFNKSLRSKSDNTSGNFVNQLRKQAKLGQPEKTERNEVALAVYFACRGKPGSARPGKEAVAIAKQIRAGKFTLKPQAPKKKSTK